MLIRIPAKVDGYKWWKGCVRGGRSVPAGWPEFAGSPRLEAEAKIQLVGPWGWDNVILSNWARALYASTWEGMAYELSRVLWRSLSPDALRVELLPKGELPGVVVGSGRVAQLLSRREECVLNRAVTQFPSLTSYYELAFLLRCAQMVAVPEALLVELGTAYGSALSVLASVCPTVSIDTYAMPDWSKEQVLENLSALPIENEFRLVEGDSRELHGVTRANLVFVDTDHEEATLREEIRVWSERLEPGGVMAFHDYGVPEYPAVKLVVDEKMKEWMPLGGFRSLYAWRKPVVRRECVHLHGRGS